MAAVATFRDLKICIFVVFFLLLYQETSETPGDNRNVNFVRNIVKGVDKKSMRLMIRTANDFIKSTFQLIDSVQYIRQGCLNTPNFEIGFLMFMIFEKYQKMVDKYNTSVTLRKGLWLSEHILYLEEIENHHFEITHLSNMLHEIERKYNITTDLKRKYHQKTHEEVKKDEALPGPEGAPELDDDLMNPKEKKKKKFKLHKFMKKRFNVTTTRKRKPWPIDYGWEIDKWK